MRAWASAGCAGRTQKPGARERHEGRELLLGDVPLAQKHPLTCIVMRQEVSMCQLLRSLTIVQRRGVGIVFDDHLMYCLVYRVCGDAWLDEGGCVLQNLYAVWEGAVCAASSAHLAPRDGVGGSMWRARLQGHYI